MFPRWLILGLSLAATAVTALAAESGRQAKPAEAMVVLRNNCLSCHNAEKKKGGLLFTSRELALKGGETGAALTPGKPAESLFLKLVQSDGDPHMPPKKQLKESEIALLRAWVEAGAAWDEKVLLQNPDDMKPVHFAGLPGSYQPVLAVALSPDETRLAVGRANFIELRDLTQTNKPVVALLDKHRDAVQSLAWTPDGKQLASGGFRQVMLWNATDFSLARELTNGFVSRVTALQFSPDSQTLFAADGIPTKSGLVHRFDLKAGGSPATTSAHKDSIYSLCLSRDGKLLATAAADKLVKLWDTATLKELGKLESHLGHVLAVAFNDDGSLLATAGADKALYIWDTKTRKQEITINRHPAPVTGLNWTADGKQLFSICEDGVARVFSEFKVHGGGERSSGATDTSLGDVGDMFYSLAASMLGKSIYVGGHDGLVYIWAADTKKWSKLAETETPMEVTVTQRSSRRKR